jgi:hypothetical protein
MTIQVKVSEWGNINPSNWSKKDMSLGKSYEVYLDGKKVLDKSKENQNDYIVFGEDFRNRNEEVYTYTVVEDYIKAQWFFEPCGILNSDNTLDYDFLMED